ARSGSSRARRVGRAPPQAVRLRAGSALYARAVSPRRCARGARRRNRACRRQVVDRRRAALGRAAGTAGLRRRRARRSRDRVPRPNRTRRGLARARMAARVRSAVAVRGIMSRLRDLLVWIAGGALLVAVAADTLAMLGRQIRFPLVGSIEIVETVVLFAAGGGLIIATLDGAHARVNLLLERLPTHWRERVLKLHALAAALLCAALL